MTRSSSAIAHSAQIFLQEVLTQTGHLAAIREQMHLRRRVAKSVFASESSPTRLPLRPKSLFCAFLRARDRDKEDSDVGETEDEQHQCVWSLLSFQVDEVAVFVFGQSSFLRLLGSSIIRICTTEITATVANFDEISDLRRKRVSRMVRARGMALPFPLSS